MEYKNRVLLFKICAVTWAWKYHTTTAKRYPRRFKNSYTVPLSWNGYNPFTAEVRIWTCREYAIWIYWDIVIAACWNYIFNFWFAHGVYFETITTDILCIMHFPEYSIKHKVKKWIGCEKAKLTFVYLSFGELV